MRLCPRCGGNHEGTACPSRDVPREEALNAVDAIEEKIRRTRFRSTRVSRWGWQGARCGVILALMLDLILAARMLVWNAGKPAGSLVVDFLVPLVAATLGSALCGFVVGMAAGVLAVGVLRPVYVALFRGIDEWEREYGDRLPCLPSERSSSREAQ